MTDQNNVISTNASDSVTFKGEYLDIFGYEGEIHLSFPNSNKNDLGSCKIIIGSQHEPKVFQGKVETDFDQKSLSGSTSGTLKLHLTLEGKDKNNSKVPSERKEFSLETAVSIRTASSYAKQAIYGVFPASPDIGLGGGVWIAWHFAT
jgi:hypothetical protein